jgi:hypothetical protein
MPSPRPPALYPHTPASGARAILHLSCSKSGLIVLLTTRISQTTTLFVHLTALSHSHYHPRDHNHGLRRLCSYCTYIPPPPRRLPAWPFYSSTPRCNVGISATLCFLASRTPRLPSALTSSRYIHALLSSYASTKCAPVFSSEPTGSDMHTLPALHRLSSFFSILASHT